MNQEAPTHPPRHIQFVWWWRQWWKLWPRSVGPYPISGPHKGVIYRWRIIIGPLEIRQWT